MHYKMLVEPFLPDKTTHYTEPTLLSFSRSTHLTLLYAFVTCCRFHLIVAGFYSTKGEAAKEREKGEAEGWVLK